jgi:hypothetical protein
MGSYLYARRDEMNRLSARVPRCGYLASARDDIVAGPRKQPSSGELQAAGYELLNVAQLVDLDVQHAVQAHERDR